MSFKLLEVSKFAILHLRLIIIKDHYYYIFEGVVVGFGSGGSSCMTDHMVINYSLVHLRGFFWEGEKVLEYHVSSIVFLRAPTFYIGGSSWEVLGVMEADVRFLKVLVRCCRAPAVMQSQVWVHGSVIKEWVYCGAPYAQLEESSRFCSGPPPGGLQPLETL